MGRNVTLAVIAVAVLGVAVYRIKGSASEESIVPSKLTNHGHCMACALDTGFTVDKNDKTPHACPDCQERALYQWMFCRDCNKKFIPNLVYRRAESEFPQPEPFFSCPACGCSSYSLFSPDDPMLEVVGTAKMPDWPVTRK